MGPRGVVQLEPFVGHLPHVRQRGEDPRIEDVVAVRLVDAFNESVRFGLPGWMCRSTTPRCSHQRTSACAINSGRLLHHSIAGAPCIATSCSSCSSTCTTRTLGSEVPISIGSASRGRVSTRFFPRRGMTGHRRPTDLVLGDTRPSASIPRCRRRARPRGHAPAPASRRRPVAQTAIQFPVEHLPDRGVRQGQLGVHPLQLRVRLLQLLQSTPLGHRGPAVLRLARELGGATDPMRPQHLRPSLPLLSNSPERYCRLG